MNTRRRSFLLGATAVAGIAALRGSAVDAADGSLRSERPMASGSWVVGHIAGDRGFVPLSASRVADGLPLGPRAEVRLLGFEGVEKLPPGVEGVSVEIDTGAGVPFTIARLSRAGGMSAPIVFSASTRDLTLTVKTRREGREETAEGLSLDRVTRGGWVLAWVPEGQRRGEVPAHFAFDVEPLVETAPALV